MSTPYETPAIFKKKPKRRMRNTPVWERKCELHPLPEFNQAEKIIARLGGPRATAKLLGVAPCTVYRWMSPIWSNGIIPTKPAAEIRRIARQNGILITKDDWNPELQNQVVQQDEADEDDE